MRMIENLKELEVRRGIVSFDDISHVSPYAVLCLMRKINEVIDVVNSITIDAVPVVRCKDCKHYRYYGKTSLVVNEKNTNAGWCMRRSRATEEYRMLADDFCSYGEKRCDDAT